MTDNTKTIQQENGQLSMTADTTQDECLNALQGVEWLESSQTEEGHKENEKGELLGCCYHHGETRMGN